MDLNIPGWNEYFMGIAEAVSKRSKDPSTKVGSVLVDQNKHIIGCGFNGMQPGLSLEIENLMWKKPEKYQYVIHSEANCLLHASKATQGSFLFTTMYPCDVCARMIASAKVKGVYYRDNKYENEITKNIFDRAGITLIRVSP
jgi:dCMP deaminase